MKFTKKKIYHRGKEKILVGKDFARAISLSLFVIEEGIVGKRSRKLAERDRELMMY